MKIGTKKILLISWITGASMLFPWVYCFAVQGVITNSEGRSFEGELKVLGGDRLSLDVAADQGSASYIFNKSSISGIEFLDAEAVEDGLDAYETQNYTSAINYLEAIHRGRSPFFKFYTRAALAEPSLALGSAYLEEERFIDATGVAGVLLGADWREPKIHTRANEILLRAFFGLKRWDETEVLAKRWCESHKPFDESALGWWILAEVHLARGELEKARWTSLQPITFSSQFPKAYLQECYQVAISSWLQDSPEQALLLYNEYQDRGYIWPLDQHPESRKEISRNETSAEEETAGALEIQEGSPEKDLNLPLEKVRKLTTQNEPSSTP
jgi:hypothetical protein